MRIKRRHTLLGGLAVAIFSTGIAIDYHAHGWWTFSRAFDAEFNAYVCTATHPDYRVTGIDNRKPFIDFQPMGVDSESAFDGTLIWRVGDSAANYIDQTEVHARPMSISWSERHQTWRWFGVPWALIDRQSGGPGRWFAIEWHTEDDRSATTAIYLDSIMEAYDWVVACQTGQAEAASALNHR